MITIGIDQISQMTNNSWKFVDILAKQYISSFNLTDFRIRKCNFDDFLRENPRGVIKHDFHDIYDFYDFHDFHDFIK